MSEQETTTWYGVARRYIRLELSEMEVLRETDGFLVRPDGRREKKVTQYIAWYPNRADALAALIRVAQSRVAGAESVLMNARATLAEIERFAADNA